MNFSCIYHRAVMFKTVRTLLLLLLLLTVSGLSAQVTITRTSSDIFYIGNAPISCNYVGYSVTNNSGGDYDTVSVTVGDFVGTGSVVGLAINEDGSINLGSIADGESKMAYFYLKATGETTNTQTHTISVFDEFGGAGNLLVDVDFDLTVENTIQANANKVTATLIGPDPAGLGGIATIEFTGETGTIGAAKILSFSPATYDNWRADVLQMLSAEIVLSGGNTATITDKLFIPTSDVLNTSNTNYVATYTFRVTNETPVDTVLSPLAFISSGTQVKHTSVSSIEALFLPPISNSLVLAKSASPAGLGIGGGQVTYTVTVTNSGIDDIDFPGQNNAILDRFVDLLPVSPAVATYVASSATYNGVSIADPTIDTDGGTGQQTLTWTGSFVVPASSSVDLTYTVAIPATVGTYGNQVIAYIEDTVIDTTTPADDNVPAVASVTVSANTPPELDNALIDQEAVYGASQTYSFAADSFSDNEDTSLDYTTSVLPSGITFDPSTRTFNVNGTVGVDVYAVTVTATDDDGAEVSDIFNITITQAPLLVSANDVSIANGDAIPSPLSATITGYVNGENFGSSDLSGSASVTTSATQGAGIGDYAIIAADGTLDSTNYSFSFAAGNLEMTNNAPELNPAAPDAPSGGGIPGQTEVYGTDLNYSFPVNTFTDVEDGTTLTYTATGVPAGVTFAPGTRTFSGQPDGGVDTYTVTVRATDSNGGFVETEFDITITQAPLLVSANDVSIANGDAIPSPLSATITGYVNGENFGSSDLSGSASVTTSATQGAGIGDYAIIAADGTLDSTNYSFSFAAGNLEMTNNAPTAPQVSNFNEADGDTPTEINVSFTDADGDDLTYSAIGLPAGITIGLNSGLINGTLGNLASAGGPLSDGVYNVIVTANDTTDTTAYPFTYTVNNPAPVAQDDGTYDVHTATLLTGNNVGDNDSDGGNDSDTLSYAILGNASNGTAAVNPDGGFTYTSNGSYAGADSFTYTVTDQQGATDTATVNINVTNDAPEIDPEVFTAKISGEFADIDVISIDASFSDDDGDTLTYSATGLPEGLSIDSDTGEITGELAHLASAGGPQNDGVYTVTVTADDGVTTTDVEFELVVLNPVPVAVDDDFEMLSSDDPSLADTVATNDSDPDGDTPFSFGISTDVSGGDLTLNPDGSFIYTPAADFYGEDSFTYTVSDSQGATSETATVTIDVVGVGGILIEPLETPELNWQTALYEQTVRVTNLHIRSIIGFRMIVNGLAQDILLFNPSGTLEDETPYIEYAQTLAAVGEDGNSVELVVELKRDSLAPFETPDYVVIEVLTSEVETATVSESGANVTSTALLADGAFIIEFNTIIGNVYAIEYSEDLENWKRVLPLYTANVEKTQWIDNGPPKTIIHPNAVDGRFYRIVTIAE